MFTIAPFEDVARWARPRAGPDSTFGARNAWQLGELGDELGDKCGKRIVVSFGGLSGDVSSVSDVDRKDKYADCRGGVFG